MQEFFCKMENVLTSPLQKQYIIATKNPWKGVENDFTHTIQERPNQLFFHASNIFAVYLVLVSIIIKNLNLLHMFLMAVCCGTRLVS